MRRETVGGMHWAVPSSKLWHPRYNVFEPAPGGLLTAEQSLACLWCMFDAEVAEIDGFLGSFKALEGLMPEWVDHHARHWQVRWGVVDEHDIQRGELCLTCNAAMTHISITAMYAQKMIYRLDVVPLTEVHPNPFGAASLGLPPSVTGPHVHGWPENRAHVKLNGFGELPYRRQIGGAVQTVSDALAWVAQDLRITVTAEQRVCDFPPQRGLF